MAADEPGKPPDIPEEPTLTPVLREDLSPPSEKEPISDQPEPPLSGLREPEIGTKPSRTIRTRRFRIPRAGIAAALLGLAAIILGIVFLGGTDDEVPTPDQTTLQAEQDPGGEPEPPPDDGSSIPDDREPPTRMVFLRLRDRHRLPT